jgi:uncharacterized membrane protein YkvA (DUF1232 family)
VNIWPIVGIALGVPMALWIALVVALVAIDRREAARSLAGFFSDCAIPFARLARDPRVPRRNRAMLFGLVAYLACPFDLVPDVIPVLGQVDDALLVAYVLRGVVRGAGLSLVADHWPGPRGSLELVLRLAGLEVSSPPP